MGVSPPDSDTGYDKRMIALPHLKIPVAQRRYLLILLAGEQLLQGLEVGTREIGALRKLSHYLMDQLHGAPHVLGVISREAKLRELTKHLVRFAFLAFWFDHLKGYLIRLNLPAPDIRDACLTGAEDGSQLV